VIRGWASRYFAQKLTVRKTKTGYHNQINFRGSSETDSERAQVYEDRAIVYTESVRLSHRQRQCLDGEVHATCSLHQGLSKMPRNGSVPLADYAAGRGCALRQ
jgi:hypothetical protein